MDESKKLTWGELKKFVNELPEDELTKDVIWWGDDRGGVMDSVYRLDEDYINMDYGYEPISGYENEEEYAEELENNERIEKGTPILSTT